MANFDIQAKTSYFNETNSGVSSKPINLKMYPGSVKELSALLMHARKESFPICDDADVGLHTPSLVETEPRGVFKKSHTCGSLFVKCRCNNENTDGQSLFQTSSDSHSSFPYKRSSNPSVTTTYNRSTNKRLSNPEINNAQLLEKRITEYSNRTKSEDQFLEHPEIPYRIHRETSVSSSRRSSSKDSIDYCQEVFGRKSNLEYHKGTVLAYENYRRHSEEAEKFLRDFGILDSMGNGVSIRQNSKPLPDNANILQQAHKNTKNLNNDSNEEDHAYLKSLVARLKKELSELEIKYGSLHSEFIQTQKQLGNKESEVLRLQREVHKLRSVLQQTTGGSKDGDILTSIQKEYSMANRIPVQQQSISFNSDRKKQGVSAESSDSTGQASDITIAKYEKDFRSKQLIKDAIMDNDFLKHLDSLQVREIVDSMYSKEFKAGSYVIREGEAGAHLFVSAEGEFEVIQEDKVLGHMGSRKAFGELAILYNCTRTASIKVNVDSKVWVLDRKVFQQIMVRTGLQRLQDNISFLRSVPLLQKLSNEVLAKIADVLEVEFYPAGAYIIRQGASGDTFFIISSGNVKVTQRLPGHLEEQEIRTLGRGDYFGEQALLKEDCRTASIIATHPGVECLTLDRDSFKHLIGDLSEIKEKDYGDEQRLARPLGSTGSYVEQQEYEYIQLDDLDVIATLGVGGFGRVELVQYTQDPSLSFALKCLKKQHVVDTQQQEHVFSEKLIMMSCRSPFICRLYKTFRDSKYVYMLLEACLGGEVWTILRDRGCFDDHTTRFIAACVIEAFEYLHARGIIYRDLKPENLLLDSKGYVKLVDFGFSKRLGYSNKTWTFCGTPEYVAPETILNKGHDRAVDYWALGILMHELLAGNPPFTASDPMKTYNLILKGIDMIDFTKHNISRSAQSLIKKLCRDSPSERLGYQRGGIMDIKKHKWFQGFDWDGLKSLTLLAPIIQPVRSPCDTSNFDCFGKDNDIPPDECSDWDIDF